MHLIYFDESGNSGENLDDPQQPIFVLGALIVPEQCWHRLEADLESSLRAHFPEMEASGAEIHANHLRNGSGPFRGVALDERISLRDAWFNVAAISHLKFIYRSIQKSKYKSAMKTLFGEGIPPNPHIAAFALLAMCINDFLHAEQALGMFISDDNKEIVSDVEGAIRQFRLASGALRLDRIVEKGFFIDSAKSRILQLCDVCVFHARKKEEAAIGKTLSHFDRGGVIILDPILHVTKKEQFRDVILWLKNRGNPKGPKN